MGVSTGASVGRGARAQRWIAALVCTSVAVASWATVGPAAAVAAPLVQQGTGILPSGTVGAAMTGSAVALSGDGSTALIGGHGDNDFAGAVWPYTRSASGYVAQASKLTPSDGVAPTDFGSAVALSTDGTTALIAGSFDNNTAGAVWFFSRSGSTWTQDGPKITQSGSGFLGTNIALSGDGSTALIASPEVDTQSGQLVKPGQVLVYVRSGSTWSLQSTITSSDPAASNFGVGLSLSRDGSTAVIGAGTASGGEASVYTRSGSTWTAGPPLTTTDAASNGLFGSASAVSANGATVLVGAPEDNGLVGAVFPFVRSGSTWVQQGPKLVPSGGTPPDLFGSQNGGLSLSDDGNTALITTAFDNNLVGGAWTFTRSGSTWTQQGSILTPSDESGASQFGWSSSLSGDGATALIGGPFENSDAGATWVFSNVVAPAVTTQPASVTVTAPATASFTVACSGSPAPAVQWQVSTDGGTTWSNDTTDAGATTATLTVSAASVAANGREYRAVCSNSAGTATSAAATLTVLAPPPPPPSVVVSSVSPRQGFAFSFVLVNGKGFNSVREVDFGARHPALFYRLNSSLIFALAPPGASGTVDVTVRTSAGTSAVSSADRFTYLGFGFFRY